MISMKREISPGYELPPWYGVAYELPHAQKFICYPIGLHIIIGLAREFYLQLRKPWMRENDYTRYLEEKRYIRWKHRVDDDFYQIGYNEGYRDGCKEAPDYGKSEQANKAEYCGAHDGEACCQCEEGYAAKDAERQG